MNYTVNQLAKLSGVTARMLRFYDTIGLLKPAFVAESGYRYYQEKELLVLQQILFFRELGFELKQIKAILKKNDFDRQAALQSHKETLKKKIQHLQTLLITIDKTINHIQGKQPMNEKELFFGPQNYASKFQEFYRNFSEKVREEAKKLHANLSKNMTAAEKKKLDQKNNKFWQDLVVVFQKGLKIDHPAVQRIMKDYISLSEHSGVPISQKQWISAAETFRTMPENLKTAAANWPEMAPQNTETIKRFDDNPGLADFLADAMKLYAEKNMSKKETSSDTQNPSPESQNFYREFGQKIGEAAKELQNSLRENMTEKEKNNLDQKDREFWQDLVTVFRKKLKIDHPDVQRLIKNYMNLSHEYSGVTLSQKQWIRTAESFRTMPENLKKAVANWPEMAPQHADKIKCFNDNPGLADFLADALKLYAERNLS